MATACYKRVKHRNGASPTATQDDFFLTVTCNCEEDHRPLRVEVNTTTGVPKGPVEGNILCWYGNLELILKYAVTDTPLMNHYVVRKAQYGTKPIGDSNIKTILRKWAETCNVPSVEVNNMWARKSFVNTTLRELQLPEQQVMDVTGHKNPQQMRNDYHTRECCTPSGPFPTPTFAAEQPSNCSSTSPAPFRACRRPSWRSTASS